MNPESRDGLVSSKQLEASPNQFPNQFGNKLLLWRVAAIVILVAITVSSPSALVLTLPFIPALVALGIANGGGRTFVQLVSVASIVAAGVAAASASQRGVWELIAVIAAAFFVPMLGIAQYRSATSARNDEQEDTQAPRDEPMLREGFTPISVLWVVVIAILTLAAVSVLGESSIQSGASKFVDESYAVYDRECSKGGSLASNGELCERISEQKSQIKDLLAENLFPAIAIAAALIAVLGAATAHLLVLARIRALAAKQVLYGTRFARRKYRLRELEFHWGLAYVVTAGVFFMLLADRYQGELNVSLFSSGVFLAFCGITLFIAHGVGLLAWILMRRPAPLWYRITLPIISLFVLPLTIVTLAILGILDMAIKPRKRAEKSNQAN